MKTDLFSIWFVIGCCLLPYFVIVTLLLGLSIRARLKYRNQILRNLAKESGSQLVPRKTTRLLAAVYVLVSIITLVGLGVISSIAVAYYLGFIQNLDIAVFSVVSEAVVAIAIVIGIILAILSKRLFQLKD